MKIGIIVGSIRDGRAGAGVGTWVAEQAAGRDDALRREDYSGDLGATTPSSRSST